MAFQNLCPPALIYLLFSITQVVIDSMKGLYNTALVKVWVAFIFTILLNFLCNLGLGIISWVIVFIPFILMTLIVAILLLMFGLDPATGKIKISDALGNNNMGQSSSNLGVDLREESKKRQKDLLDNSLIFYAEDEQNPKSTSKYVPDKGYLDTNMFKLIVYQITNILSGIGEQEIAAYFQSNALSCARDTQNLPKGEAQKYLIKCYNNLYSTITKKLPSDREARVRYALDTFLKDFNIDNM
jgi:hypothetical protein